VNRASEATSTQGFLLALEPRIATFAFPLALLLERTRAKEVLEGVIQIPQGLLKGTLGNLVHPRKVSLSRVDLWVQIHGRWDRQTCSITFLLATKPIIVGPASSTAMLLCQRDLCVIQIQFGLIASFHQHGSASAFITCSTQFLICSARRFEVLRP
jgi:hypothetical protein